MKLSDPAPFWLSLTLKCTGSFVQELGALRSTFAQSFLLRQRMLHFLQNFAYYMMVMLACLGPFRLANSACCWGLGAQDCGLSSSVACCAVPGGGSGAAVAPVRNQDEDGPCSLGVTLLNADPASLTWCVLCWHVRLRRWTRCCSCTRSFCRAACSSACSPTSRFSRRDCLLPLLAVLTHLVRTLRVCLQTLTKLMSVCALYANSIERFTNSIKVRTRSSTASS